MATESGVPKPPYHDLSTTRSRHWATVLLVFTVLSVALSGCGAPATGYDLAAEGAARATPAALRPLSLPRDEGPHDNLTEWWYYTGHLEANGRRYGFEYVIFQSVREGYPTGYVSHFAVTDETRGNFTYDQRTFVGPQPGRGFDLRLGDWTMRGAEGTDNLSASMQDYAISLTLTATKPPVLHDGDGVVSFGPAGDSYYYSRTRMTVIGEITDHGKKLPATGQAWMDHQWGDFISVAGGGWDWFSAQLEDGSDVTISIVRNRENRTVLAYGTYVEPDGTAVHLSSDEFVVTSTAQWKSPHTDATYPARWNVRLPKRNLDLNLTPVVADQELDTRASTGVAYWEGAVEVVGDQSGRLMRGRGYVELTGYNAGAPQSR